MQRLLTTLLAATGTLLLASAPAAAHTRAPAPAGFIDEAQPAVAQIQGATLVNVAAEARPHKFRGKRFRNRGFHGKRFHRGKGFRHGKGFHRGGKFHGRKFHGKGFHKGKKKFHHKKGF